MKQNRKPSWWLANSLLIGMIIALFFVQKMPFDYLARIASQIGIVITGYGLVWRWLTANASALKEEQERKQKAFAEKLRREAEKAHFEDHDLNPQQIHYLQTVKAKRQ